MKQHAAPIALFCLTLTETLCAQVTLNGDLHLNQSNPGIYVGSGLNGNGQVFFDIPWPSYAYVGYAYNAVIGPGVALRTGVGSGIIGTDTNNPLTNQGVISAETPGQAIALLSSGVTNTGTLATSAGTLEVNSSLTNSGAVSVTGGTFQVNGDLTNTGTITLSAGRFNYGPVNLATLGTFTRTGGTVALTGTFTNATTTDVLTAAVGPWALGNNGLVVGGTLNPPVPGFALQLLDGTATLDSVTIGADITPAPGSTLQLSGTWTNNKSISSAGATVSLGDFGMNNGPVTVASGGILRIGNISSPGSLTATDSTIVVIAGGVTGTTTSIIRGVSRSNAPVQIAGTLNNAGDMIHLDDPLGSWTLSKGEIDGGVVAVLNGSPPATLGRGTLRGVTLRVPELIANFVSIRDGLTLDNTHLTCSGLTAIGAAQAITGNGEIISPSTRLTIDGGSGLTIGPGVTVRTGANGINLAGTTINQGMVSAQLAGGNVALQDTFTNSGVLEARNGSSVVATAGTNLTNYSAVTHTLSDGTYAAYNNSSINLVGATITTNAANIVLSGPSSVFAAIAPIDQNSGSFSLFAGRDFATQGALSNVATILLGAGSDLSVTSAFTQTASARLAFEISGTAPEEYGRLTAASLAALDGTLSASLFGTYQPQLGDTFVLISGSSITGTFANYDLPPLPPGMQWQPIYSPTTMSLTVSVPEPNTYGLAIFTVTVYVCGRRRRPRPRTSA